MKKTKYAKISAKLPQIELERIILRKLLFEDAEDMFDYARTEEASKYLTWTPHPDIEYTKAYLRYVSQRYRTGDCFDWAVIDKNSGKMIGTCSIVKIDYKNNSAEVGYVINPKFQRRGFAPEATKAVIKFGFEVMEFERIAAWYIIENTASRKVMEKCGMSFEGVCRHGAKVKDKYCDMGICSIIREDFIRQTAGETASENK